MNISVKAVLTSSRNMAFNVAAEQRSPTTLLCQLNVDVCSTYQCSVEAVDDKTQSGSNSREDRFSIHMASDFANDMLIA